MKITRYHFKTIDSTNTWAKNNQDNLDRDTLTLITAEEQTKGYGRFNRKWISPPKQNIYATFCFWLERRLDIGNIPQVMALSVAEVLEELGFKPILKWPNDILLSGKKVSGILCQTTPSDAEVCIILGVGINVNMPLEELQCIDQPATSLYAEEGKELKVDFVVECLQDNFKEKLDCFKKQGFSPFLAKYRERMNVWKERLIQFHDELNIWQGYYDSINDDGSLNLRLLDGTVKRFLSGEVRIGEVNIQNADVDKVSNQQRT